MNLLALNPSEGFLLELVLKGALLMTVAFAITFLFRRASAALRHAVWSLAFVGLLLLPICSALLPSWQVSVLGYSAVDSLLPAAIEAPRADANQTAHVAGTPPGVESESSASPVVSSTPEATTAMPKSQEELGSSASNADASKAWSWTSIALAVWVIGAVALLIRLALVLGKLSFLRRLAIRVHNRKWMDHSEALSEVMDIHRPVQLLQHEEIEVPMTYGVRRPVIFLPPHAIGWSDEQMHVTLMHELLHIKRCDHFFHVLALMARALHWFNPLTWAATKRLVVERERACDDGVLAMGVASTSYADHLLGMARQILSGREASVAVLAMARPSELRTRIVAILDPAQPRLGLTRVRLAGLAGCALILVVSLAAVQPAATDASSSISGHLEVDETVDAAAFEVLTTLDMQQTPYAQGEVGARSTPDGQQADGEQPTSEDRRAAGAQFTPEGRQAAGAQAAPETPSTAERSLSAEADEDDDPAGAVREVTSEIQRVDAQVPDTSEIETQRRALHAISELPRDRSIPLLTEIARTHTNPELRQDAVFWLGEVGDADDSVAELLETFARSDANADVQRKAIFALSEMDETRGLPRLANIARSHSSDELRAEAVFWLGESGGADVADDLATFARSDASKKVQKKAIFALAELDDRAGVTHLIDLAKTHPNGEVRSDAIFWLGETGDPRAADVLMDIVNGR